MRRARALVTWSAGAALILCAHAAAQTREALRTKYSEPAYPEGLYKTQRQGNVLLAGRIDAEGHIGELSVIAATNKGFVEPALAAVRAWQFQPALRDGKPIEVFANIGVRFRLSGDQHGGIGAPILGDLSISPADSAGRKTAPEGFPIRRGKDAALRAEVLLDVTPSPEARTLTVALEAISPGGKRVPVFQPPVAVPPNAGEVRFPVVMMIAPDSEEGVWALHFRVNGSGAGGGQFWVATDPAHFHFVIPIAAP